MEAPTTIQLPAALEGSPHPGVRSLVPAPDREHGRARTDLRRLRLPLLFLGVDALVLALATAAAAIAPLSAAGAPPIFWSLAYGAVVVAALAKLGAYSRRPQTERLEMLRSISAAVVLGAMAVLSAYVLVTAEGSAGHQIAGLAAYAFGLLTAGRLVASFAISHGLLKHELRRRALILGAGKIGNLTARRLMAQPDLGLEPVGFLDDAPLEIPAEPAVLPVRR